MRRLPLKPLNLKVEGNGGFDNERMSIRASADGSAFAAWSHGVSPSGIRFLSIKPPTADACADS